MAGNMQRFTVILTIIVLSALPAAAAQAGTPLTLPVEVVGENGTTSSVTVEIPTPLARRPVRRLRVRQKAPGSVPLDRNPWFELRRHGERRNQRGQLGVFE